MQKIIGCDPGRYGAFTVYDPTTKKAETFKMPSTLEGIFSLLKNYQGSILFLEKQQFRGKQDSEKKTKNGKVSIVDKIAVLYANYCHIQAFCVAIGIELHELSPQTWQKPYQELTKGLDYSTRKTILSKIADSIAKEYEVKNYKYSADSLLIMDYGVRSLFRTIINTR